MSEYDAFAEHFSQTRQKAWKEFDVFLPLIQKGDRVLDLGCGNARLRQSLPEEKVPRGHYFGLDISQELLTFARRSNPGDHFFWHDFQKKLPFGSDNFEWVVAIAAFHHLLSPSDQKFFLAECHRVLKKGGHLFLTTWKLPQKHFWSNILHGRWKNWIIPFGKEKKPRTYRKVSDTELKKLLRKAGFEVERAELFEGRNYIVLGKKK
ncbi:class I SAM-dependent methyltransferase [Candidatus Gracilibacteria bacterium]|nr:class I SAM-dependent methyltransferase [Candidatus Gracilibacteria bacterium]MCF7819121.1 class I SAM-dependent methyltransferase [Candidatus Gracilibacteria bacterium]